MAGVIQLVRQGDAQGCGFACLAMVTSQSYDFVLNHMRSTYPGKDFNERFANERGIHHGTVEWYLGSLGFAYRTTYRAWAGDKPWPPEPFAPAHIASVTQPSGNQHFVVMTDEGVVLDPMNDEPTTLDQWGDKVMNVTGIWKVI